MRNQAASAAVSHPQGEPSPCVWTFMPLSGKEGGFVLIDREDYDELSQYKWHKHSAGYAARVQRYGPRKEGKQRVVYMHRYLLDLEHGDENHTDHRNRNRLDNRKSNLRVCTAALNHQNKERKRKGAYWDKSRNKWVAQVKLNGVTKHLGRYDNEQDAQAVALAYRQEHMPFAND